MSVLEESGFTVRRRSHRVPGLGVVVDVVAEDARGQPWYFDVTGAFTTTGDGLVRTDTLWKCLGRSAALAGDGRTRPLVLLTTQLPSRRSAGDRAIRAVGPGVVFDALEMQREREAWIHENKEAISAKIERGLTQLDRGEGILGDKLRTRLAADKAAWLKDRSDS